MEIAEDERGTGSVTQVQMLDHLELGRRNRDLIYRILTNPDPTERINIVTGLYNELKIIVSTELQDPKYRNSFEERFRKTLDPEWIWSSMTRRTQAAFYQMGFIMWAVLEFGWFRAYICPPLVAGPSADQSLVDRFIFVYFEKHVLPGQLDALLNGRDSDLGTFVKNTGTHYLALSAPDPQGRPRSLIGMDQREEL